MTGAAVIVTGRRPRLGFLGVGWIGRNRMEGIARAGLGEVAALADASPEALALSCEAMPDAVAALDMNDLLELDLDAVVIATPSAMHADQAIRALEHGLAVFCQKPLARTADETRRVVDAARRTDRRLGVDFSYRTLRGTRRMRELLRSGAIGRVHAVELVFHNAYGPDKPWFYDPAQSGGGAVIDLGIHLIDLMLWCLDRPRVTGVSSRLWSHGQRLVGLEHRGAVEDLALATLDLEDGVAARLACSWNLPAGCPAVIEATFYGATGALSWRNTGGSFYDFETRLQRGTGSELLESEGEGWGPLAAIDFTAAVARDARFDPSVEEVVEVAEIVDRIYGRPDRRQPAR